ncbi:transcriptional regulator LeuO [Cedecea davisae]|uniref:Transcriptional regulator LeuO n=1 Tax=Cedecea davisae TaxID=158484 RepID=A0ABS6DFK3_9ENTR|nr:transcriptional regulator LeuO [Cedecea davisae]MBU4681903.1 transcriptional regulator LeuO [Cedecea davisae]MBU4686039.1 transcriptional regulator LeuO [Cedecea davisae]
MTDELIECPDVQEIIKSQLREVDLNLLTVFDAVMQAESITGAARLLGMSQPAVSNAVSRLKIMFNDELFVRYGRGIQPTGRAFQLSSIVRHVLQLVQNELPGAGFDPLGSERVFNICISSPLDNRIIPIFYDAVKYSAPYIQLGFKSCFGPDIEHQMRHQKVDFVISYEEFVRPEFKRMALFKDEMVLVTGPQHPGFRDSFSITDFYNERHATASLDNYGSFSFLWYDTAEKQNSIAWQGVAITSVLNVVSQTQLVGVAPRWLAEKFANELKINIFSLPFAQRNRTCYLSWHESAGQDRGHLWMQTLIKTICCQ